MDEKSKAELYGRLVNDESLSSGGYDLARRYLAFRALEEQSVQFIHSSEADSQVKPMHTEGYRVYLDALKSGDTIEPDSLGEVQRYGYDLARYILDCEQKGVPEEVAREFISDAGAALPTTNVTDDRSLDSFL